MKDNLVTIVIPVYNGEKSIKKCLESVRNQNYKKWELIVVNDGSTDASEEVLSNVLKQPGFADNQVKVLHQDNSGVACARNRGIFEAKGAYITFIDQDDYIKADYIKTLLSDAVNKKADIVVSGYYRTGRDGKNIKEVALKQTEWAKFMNLAPWGKLYKTSFLKKNNLHFLDVKKGEDCYLNILAYSKTERIFSVPYIGYFWVDQQQSVTNQVHTKISRDTDIRIMFDCILKDIDEKCLLPGGLFEYYFVKASIYDFLFSARKSGVAETIRLKNELFSWLDKNFPQWRKNRNISFFRPYGEQTFTKLAVKGFCLFDRLGLEDRFLKLYCKWCD